ncbi:MAG: hypothetical protein NNA23_12510 [Nitrospira sp.]|nr:hypothetical protein [Nitrospira sp.]MCP9464320.1 hypothetical protein [Nitrospira sp.]
MTSARRSGSWPSLSSHKPLNRQKVFASLIRWVLAPLVLWVSGFFTANFVLGGQYSWPQTSRVLVLTATVLILSYEFVYKEQLSLNVSAGQAKAAVVYACLLPYLVGWATMLARWIW